MALFGRGTPSRPDDPRRGGSRDVSRQFMAVAEEFRRAGRLREAIETLENGLRENRGYVAAHVALGRAFQSAELFPKAILAFQDALKIDRENLVAVRQLAECYLKTGEKLEALKKLKLFRGLNPGEKDVSELITQLEAELQAAKRPAVEKRESTGSFGLRTGPVPRPIRTGTIPPISPRATAPRLSVDTLPGVYVPPASAPSAPPPAEVVRTPDFDALLRASTAPPPSPPPPPVRAFSAFESFLSEPPAAPSPAVAEAPPVPEPPPPPLAAAVIPEPAPLLDPFVFEAPAPAPMEIEPPMEPMAAAPQTPITGPEPQPPFVPEPEPQRPIEPGPFATTPAAPVSTEDSFWEDEERAQRPPILLAAEIEEESRVPAELAPEAAAPPEVTETLAEIYREQGYLGEAAEAYKALAGTATDASAAEGYREKASEIAAERSTPAARLRAYARRFPVPPSTRIEEMGGVLDALRTRAPGVRAIVLTDLEGLPVVTAGEGNDATSETLVAELTAFWKSVQRTEADVGAGALRAVSLRGNDGTALVTSVSAEYSLILHVERDVPLGRIRYEAARAAGLLRPALA